MKDLLRDYTMGSLSHYTSHSNRRRLRWNSSPSATVSAGTDGLHASSGCSVASDTVDGSDRGGYGTTYAAAMTSVAVVDVT